MTSHYMRCKVTGSFEQLMTALVGDFGNVHNEQWNTADGRRAVILGESYFFRVNSDAAILLILKEFGPSQTELEIISCAGAAGLIRASCGTEKTYVHEIHDRIQDSGFQIEVLKEINYYSASSEDQ